jgi:prepilin-type N-terminal cleavage/methylation domain-containing protein
MHQPPECTPQSECTPPRVPLLACQAVPSRETRSRSTCDRPAERRGFTLTEMLVVITIIAILASLASVAVVRALDTAKQTRIKLEVDNLDAALKAYKEKYGSYPPCDLRFTGVTPIPNPQTIQHVARLFPRYNMGAGYANLIADLKAAGVDTVYFRPDQALVFWLRGFGPDPTNPFSLATPLTPLFDFDRSRLAQIPTVPPVPGVVPIPSYFPAGVKPDTSGAPYVYWDALSYTYVSPTATAEAQANAFNAQITTNTTIPPMPAIAPIFVNAGTAMPYWADIDGNGASNTTASPTENWVNPDSFQIIAPGMDAKYGTSYVGATAPFPARLYPTGTYYDASNNFADDDNITNFCNKARLGDAKP